MWRLYLAGLPRLQSFTSVPHCQGSCLADESRLHQRNPWVRWPTKWPRPCDIINMVLRALPLKDEPGYISCDAANSAGTSATIARAISASQGESCTCDRIPIRATGHGKRGHPLTVAKHPISVGPPLFACRIANQSNSPPWFVVRPPCCTDAGIRQIAAGKQDFHVRASSISIKESRITRKSARNS
jgi:hypothetical protein